MATPPGFWDHSLGYDETVAGSLADVPTNLPEAEGPDSAGRTPSRKLHAAGVVTSASAKRRRDDNVWNVHRIGFAPGDADGECPDGGGGDGDGDVSLLPEPPQLPDPDMHTLPPWE